MIFWKTTQTIFIFIVLSLCKADFEDIESKAFSIKIKELIQDSLKVKDMQEFLNSIEYKDVSRNSCSDTSELFEKTQHKVNELNTAIERLENAYLFLKYPTSRSCCHFKDQFQVKSNVCSSSQKPVAINAKEYLASAAKNLQQFPFLKWQYACELNGGALVYPASYQFCSNKNRKTLHNWCHYVTLNVPKKVVIALDTSYSMFNEVQTDGKIKIEAAKFFIDAVLKILSVEDQFALFTFSPTEETVDKKNCFLTSFAAATDRNKNLALLFLDSLSPRDETSIGDAFKKTFRYFNEDKHYSKKYAEGMILITDSFLCGDCLKNIQEQYLILKQSFSIFVYTFIEKGNINEKQYLRQLPLINSNPLKHGRFAFISSSLNEHKEAVAIEQNLNDGFEKITTTYWSLHNILDDGVDEVLSVSKIIYRKNKIIGAVGVTANFREIFSEVLNFYINKLSYSFILHQSGIVIHHPMKKRGVLGYFQITVFEKDKGFLSVLEAIKRGNDGNTMFLATKSMVQQPSNNLGSVSMKVRLSYVWKKLSYSSVFICVVCPIPTTLHFMNTTVLYPLEDFLFHRLDIISPKVSCKHLNKKSSSKLSSVFIENHGFKNSHFWKAKLTKRDIEDIAKWLNGTKENKFGMKVDVKQDVILSNRFNYLWRGEKHNLRKNIIWQFFIAESGVFRIFPGIQSEDSIKYTSSSLYLRVISQKKEIVVFAPHNEKHFNHKVITMAQVLFRKRNSYKSRFGIVGVTLTYNYFYQKLLEVIDDIPNKFNFIFYVIDGGGYVIFFQDQTVLISNTLSSHIASLEPNIFLELINKEVFRKVNCSLFESLKVHREYEMVLSEQKFVGKARALEKCNDFMLQQILETSLYLLVKNVNPVTCQNVLSFFVDECQCRYDTCLTRWYGETLGTNCECPCSVDDPSIFSPCNLTLSKESAFIPPFCLTRFERQPLRYKITNEEDNLNLPTCFPLLTTRLGWNGKDYLKSLIVGLIFFVIVSSYVLFLSLKEHRLFKRKRQVKANAADRARAEMERMEHIRRFSHFHSSRTPLLGSNNDHRFSLRMPSLSHSLDSGVVSMESLVDNSEVEFDSDRPGSEIRLKQFYEKLIHSEIKRKQAKRKSGRLRDLPSEDRLKIEFD